MKQEKTPASGAGKEANRGGRMEKGKKGENSDEGGGKSWGTYAPAKREKKGRSNYQSPGGLQPDGKGHRRTGKKEKSLCAALARKKKKKKTGSVASDKENWVW